MGPFEVSQINLKPDIEAVRPKIIVFVCATSEHNS